jgi:hypothetical protein
MTADTAFSTARSSTDLLTETPPTRSPRQQSAFFIRERLQIGGRVTGFKNIREKNAAILFAELKKWQQHADLPLGRTLKHIRLVASERVGMAT